MNARWIIKRHSALRTRVLFSLNLSNIEMAARRRCSLASRARGGDGVDLSLIKNARRCAATTWNLLQRVPCPLEWHLDHRPPFAIGDNDHPSLAGGVLRRGS